MSLKGKKLRHGSLFSGIGGFDLAAQWMGWENVFHCEWMPFPRKILNYHFPNSISYEDITKTDFSIHRGGIDILTGGFPCQPYSQAGKRLGKEDERHLWPEMLRAIQEIEPTFVVGENVRGLVNWNGGMVFEEVCVNLESQGYEVQPILLPACSVGAPHRRDRIWFVAYSASARAGENFRGLWSESKRCDTRKEDATSTSNTNLYGCRQEWGYDRSCENVVGSNNEEFGATNPKDFNGCNPNGYIEGESCSCEGTCVKRIYEANEAPISSGICKLDKDFGDIERISGETKLESNENRTLVQDGSDGIQLPINRGLGDNQDSLPGLKGDGLQNDLSRVNRMEGENNGEGHFTYSNSNGLERGISSNFNKQEQGEGAYDEKCISIHEHRIQFENFPTQSPICGGDDGLPTELDGITFSKWRAESIKGYGNAIVPQVAFEIFKAISSI